MAVLILCDYDEARLSPATAKVINAAKMLSDEIDVLIAGANVEDVAKNVAKLDGVSRVLLADDANLAHQCAPSICHLIKNLAKNYTHILANANAVGRDVMPRLAAILDVMPITDVIKINSKNEFDRPIYAGNAIVSVKSEQALNLLTIRASVFNSVAKNNDAKIEKIGVDKIDNLIEFIKAQRTKSDMADLSIAQIVIAGGQAFENKEEFLLLKELGKILNAPVGATRAAVELGYSPNETQIGQSGKIIAPDLYIAFGISGALQHLAGISGAKKIIAINSDADAPIMKIADVAMVGDIKDILPQLIEKLSA